MEVDDARQWPCDAPGPVHECALPRAEDDLFYRRVSVDLAEDQLADRFGLQRAPLSAEGGEVACVLHRRRNTLEDRGKDSGAQRHVRHAASLAVLRRRQLDALRAQTRIASI